MKRMTLKRTIPILAALSALAAASAALAAGIGANETLEMTDTSTTGQTFAVVATGAFTDGGTFHSADGGKASVLRLSGGSITVKSTFTSAPKTTVNHAACSVTEHSRGTVAVVGGTGAFAGITGSGTFTQSARQVGVVGIKHAKCSTKANPAGSLQSIVAHLSISIP
jgi:hypothetical protein